MHYLTLGPKALHSQPNRKDQGQRQERQPALQPQAPGYQLKSLPWSPNYKEQTRPVGLGHQQRPLPLGYSYLQKPGNQVLGHLQRPHSKNRGYLKVSEREALEGNLVLVRVEEASEIAGEPEEQEPWIGLLPVDSTASRGGQESFADAVVNKMKRALVLGASALIILALHPNPVSEMDLSPVLSKPIIVVQTSENVTKLIGALLRGLRATAKITYQSILQDDLGGATLTLWSSCGRSRGGLYGEWQGVICTGESNSQVQKYLQQLWDTVLLVALILCTGVIIQARWQHQDRQPNDNFQFPKQDVLRSMSLLKTRPYRQPKRWCGPSQPTDADICAVCLEAFRNNQCLRVLPCLHEYHRDCVDPWLLLQHTCPLCKRSILGESPPPQLQAVLPAPEPEPLT
uniref:RING-type domain-containing protein n=1 Tax=Oryzias latipes TaxID=8090 RepID=A0A3P9HEG3_ORYLA